MLYHVFMYSTHLKGILGELEFTTHLIRQGFTVLNPINPNSSYDLVIEKNGKFTKIQIKYCTPRKTGILRVELDRPMRKTKNYLEREVDAMGVYDSINHNFYLVPVNSIKSKTEIWLRIKDTKNKQLKKINLAKKYKI